MKLSQLILFMGLSFALGIGVMTIFQSNKESQKPVITENTQKGDVQKESNKNNSSPTNLSSNLSNSPKTTKPKIVEPNNNLEEDEPAGPEEAFAKLLNSPEARNLMKGFAGAMSRGADRMIAAEMESQKEKLDLSDAQV